jgi:hypothetical protein
MITSSKCYRAEYTSESTLLCRFRQRAAQLCSACLLRVWQGSQQQNVLCECGLCVYPGQQCVLVGK